MSDYYRCALNVTGDGELSDGGCDAYDDSRFAFTRRARVSCPAKVQHVSSTCCTTGVLRRVSTTKRRAESPARSRIAHHIRPFPLVRYSAHHYAPTSSRPRSYA